jgi:NADH dehydrogenase
MSTHRLSASQLVPRPIDEVFAFFADAGNLARITPPSMGLRFRDEPGEMREGLLIDYRITPLFGIPVGWQTRIDAWDPPRRFRDVQLRGPYRRWEHEHSFEAVDGGTLVRDEIEYEVPFGPLGDLVNRLAVRAELRRIFQHRAHVIDGVFAPAAPPTGTTVAVAGGTGMVGGAIAAELHRRGNRVIVLSHRGEDARGALPDAVEIRTADVQTGDGLAEALHGVDWLAIALAFPNSPMESPRRGRTFMAIDAEGTERLVAAARSAGVGRIVYISGAGAAPEGRHWFRAKWRAEQAVRASGLTWTIIRPTWIYGPRDVSLNRFLGFARRLPFVPLSNLGNQPMAPVFVDDAARLAADAFTDGAAAGQVLELGGPETMSMREVVARALRTAGLRRPVLPGPAPLLKLAAWPLKFLPRPPLTPDAVDFVNQSATVDTGPLQERMPRRLTRFEDGLRTYLGPPSRSDRRLEFDRAQ